MPSTWITRRLTTQGEPRYRVLFRLGGRESTPRYGGSFATKREALARKAWVVGELAAMRVPDVKALRGEARRAPTLEQAVRSWRASRVDVAEGTRVVHQVALDRVLPLLGGRRVDEIGVEEVKQVVTALAQAGRRRETIKKSVMYLAAVLDEAGVAPNPARDRSIRLPREEPVELEPPASEHVEAVFRLLPPAYRLPLLWLDWSGARVGSIATLRVGDYDEQQRRVRLRAATTKTRAALWVELPDPLADAIEATLRPRDDRDPQAPLFPGASPDALRTAIARACRAAGVPAFSPHDLRHRRISLLHRQGRTWAEIGRFVGQRKLSVTADTYTHVLTDGRELDIRELLRSLTP